jgi:hypothetical protein
MLVAVVGLLAVAFLWVVGAVLLKVLRDLPLGPVNMRVRGDEYSESVKRNIAAQHRLADFWWRRLWPVPLVCLLVAVVIAATAGK